MTLGNNSLKRKISAFVINLQSYISNEVSTHNSNSNAHSSIRNSIPSASSSTPSADVTGGAVGSSSNYAKADHQHPLSSAYATSSHTHTVSNITDLPTIPSKTSDLTNDSGFISEETGTLTELQGLIDDANDVSGDVTVTRVINLTKDYKYDSTADTNLTSINAAKNLVIKGNGHTIDCNGQPIQFNFTTSSSTTSYKTLELIDCHFLNNTGAFQTYQKDTGIFNIARDNVIISNCIFEKCAASQSPGNYKPIISVKGDNNIIIDTVFRENKPYAVATLYITNGFIDNCSFVNNTLIGGFPVSGWNLYGEGCGIYVNGNTLISNTDFIGNSITSPNYGGSGIHINSGTVKIINNFFTQNGSPYSSSSAIYVVYNVSANNNVTCYNNTFSNNYTTVDTNCTNNNYLTQHQDISSKEDSSNKVSSWSATTTDTNYPSEKLVKDSLDGKAPSSHNHSYTDITNVETVQVTVTYTDSSTSTINLLKYTGS